MESNELYGVIVPVITPVDDEDQVEEHMFRKMIQRLIDSGVDALFIGGSAGEGPLLTFGEWVRLAEIAFDECNGKIKLLCGVSDASTRRVIEKIKVLNDIGYNNFVLTPTFYYTLTEQEEVLRLFGACKDAGENMEMVAYNIPSCTYSEISIETLLEMTRRKWIRYCKESSGDLFYIKRLMSRAEEVDLKVLIGDEGLIAAGLELGACGIIPVCANFEPVTFIQAYKACKNNNIHELIRIQERIDHLRKNIPQVGSCWISGVKYAVSQLGLGSGKPVSPLQPLSDEEKAKISVFIKKN